MLLDNFFHKRVFRNNFIGIGSFKCLSSGICHKSSVFKIDTTFFVIVESIHPKHNASSTTSIYGIHSYVGCLEREVITQQDFAWLWLAFSQFLSSMRSVKSSRLIISIFVRSSMIYDYPNCFCKQNPKCFLYG